MSKRGLLAAVVPLVACMAMAAGYGLRPFAADTLREFAANDATPSSLQYGDPAVDGAPANRGPIHDPVYDPPLYEEQVYHWPGIIPGHLDVEFGVFDPEKDFASSPSLSIEHFYISWVPGFDQRADLKRRLEYAYARGRKPLLTVEPFPGPGQNASTLLNDIVKGHYDEHIEWVCSTVGSHPGTVLMRWGHEMEYVTGRYPWATEDSQAFVAAYRYFNDRCEVYASNLLHVWSPAGNYNLQPYWPGADYVDAIGITLYGFPEWDVYIYGWVLSFEEGLAEKYERVASFSKPVIIAELGVTEEPAYQSRWLAEGFQSLHEFPLVQAIIYFNSIDPVAWAGKFRNPDWRIDRSILRPGQ